METPPRPRSPRRRLRLTIGGMLALVALAAVFLNRVRPVSEAEAKGIAERRFLAIPGASAWAGHYEARPRYAEPLWIVNIVSRATNEPIAQVSLDRRGLEQAAVVSLPGTAAPTPADYLPGPLPPPDRWKVDPNGPQSYLVKPTPTPPAR